MKVRGLSLTCTNCGEQHGSVEVYWSNKDLLFLTIHSEDKKNPPLLMKIEFESADLAKDNLTKSTESTYVKMPVVESTEKSKK